MVNWALARASGWRLLLRIEDLDAPRVKLGAEEEIRRSLGWLGIEWDSESERQSTRGARYEDAMRNLSARGLVFESPHSRAEVRAHVSAEAREAVREEVSAKVPAESAATAPASPASAPHGDGATLCFPRALRPALGPKWRFEARTINHRFRMDDALVEVHDEVMGRHAFPLADDPGDPIVWSKAGVAAYQLAVVVDDAAGGVTDVVRGEDLLQSAAIQSVLAKALGFLPPRWWHLPLVLDDEGRRLSKRDGDLSLAALRELGCPPERIVGLIAFWVGVIDALEPMSAKELPTRLNPEHLKAWSRRDRPRVDASVRRWLEGAR